MATSSTLPEESSPATFTPRADGKCVVHVEVVSRRPVEVVLDPFYKLVDRNRRDNVRAVEPNTASLGGANIPR